MVNAIDTERKLKNNSQRGLTAQETIVGQKDKTFDGKEGSGMARSLIRPSKQH